MCSSSGGDRMSYKHNKAWRHRNKAKRNAERKRYYRKSQGAPMTGKTWSVTDSNFILTSEGPDSVIHTVIGCSVEAIQLKRSKLRKEV